jgi:hypothetical protein
MAQLSRPYQIALGAIALLAAVWFLALRGHSTSSSSSPSAATSSSVSAPKAPAPSSPYHGAVPGVAGLTRDIEKARSAAAASEHNAAQLERRSAEASSSGPVSKSGGVAAVTPAAGSHTKAAALPHTSTRTHSPVAAARPKHLSVTPKHLSTPVKHTSTHNSQTLTPAKQTRLEGELKRGDTVILLFWDPRGADDQAVRHELQALQGSHAGGRIVLQVAKAGEVGAFGSFTRAVQVFLTPTILIILPNGRTSTLTGLTDSYSVRQAINEARQR